MTDLKSLVEIEITSASAVKGSSEIVGGLNKVDVAADKAATSAKKLNSQFDKTNKTIADSSASLGQDFKKSSDKIVDAIEKMGSEYGKSSKSAKTFSEAAGEANKKASSFPDDATKKILAYGAAYVSINSVMSNFITINSEFQTGLIGVAKTTNLAGNDLKDFASRIQKMSTEIPVSTTELLELAQAAGQMGVRGSANLEKFATVMAKVGRSTDLSGADAARGLARILTVSGESSDGLETLANVIVKMGNNSKATESEIAGMTTRIAQALSVYGVASSQSVGLAAAMKSIGLTAELGGSAVGRAMQEITNSVNGGSAALSNFSKKLALDPKKLEETFRTDKIAAFTYLLEGVRAKGENAGLALKEVGLGGTEIASTLIPLSKNINLLTDSLAMAKQEVKDMSALNKEFAAANETFNSQLIVSQNTLKKMVQDNTASYFTSLTKAMTELNEAAKNGGLNRLVDIISIASIAIASRFVPSVLLANNGLIAKTATMIRYNFAVAAMVGATRTAAVGHIALAGAVATGNAALALMGGPVGAVLLAAGALAYFATRTTDAESAVEKLGSTVEETVQSFEKLSQAKQKMVFDEISAQALEANDEVAKLKKTFDELNSGGSYKQKALVGDVSSKMINDAAIALEDASNKANELNKKLEAIKNPAAFKEMIQDANDLEHAFDPIAPVIKSTTDEVKNLSEESAKLLKTVKRQADLYFNKSEAVAYAYDLEHGLIERSDKDVESQISAQYRLIDARNDQFEQIEREMKIEDQLRKYQKDRLDLKRKSSEEEYKQAQEANKKLEDQYKEAAEESAKPWEEAAKRIDNAFAGAWAGAFDSFTSFRDQMTSGIKQLVGELIHQMTTKKLTDAFLNMSRGGMSSEMKAWQTTPVTLDNAFSAAPVAKKATSGASGMLSGIGGMMGGVNPYVIAAAAVVAGVSVWNKMQDAKFEKMTSEYKQSNQGMSNVLGMGLVKSDTINKSIEKLRSVGGDTLSVNYGMLQQLIAIKEGISGVASGFAKTLVGGANYETMGIKEGKKTIGILDQGGYAGAKTSGFIAKIDEGGVMGQLNDAIHGFMTTVMDKVSGFIYNSKKKVIDAGVQIIGKSLSEVLSGATLEAFNYADVQTQRKVFTITASTTLKRQTENLDEIFKEQITDVFFNAGQVLKTASKTFGIDFDKYAKDLIIKTQDLSLKGLKGEDLTKAIESFFGSNLDSWAAVLLKGTDFLNDFQKIGESAFDTMIRLAAETESFISSAKLLGLKFNATGADAIYLTQAFAKMSGGFDALSSKLSIYYNKFFTEEEKFKNGKDQLTAAFKEIGFVIPDTKEKFKELISTFDLSIDSQAQQANKLLNLVDILDQYYSVKEEMEKRDIELREQNLKKDMEMKEQALKKEQEIIAAREKQIASTKEFANFVKLLGLKNSPVQQIHRTSNFSKEQIEAAYKNAPIEKIFGGLDALNEKLSSFYENFIKEEDKFFNEKERLTAAIKELGIPLPDTREKFNELMKTFDIGVESQAIQANKLLSSIELIDQYYSMREEIEAKQLDYIDNFVSGMRDFNDAIKDAADAARSAYDEIIGSISQSRSSVSESIASILKKSTAPSIASLKEKIGKGTAKEQIENINSLNAAIVKKYDSELDRINSARDAARQAHEEQMSLNKQNANNQLSAAKQMLEYSIKLKDTADSLLLSDLSTLLPQAKLEESKRQFEAATPENMASAAQDYLKNARDYYASSADYTQIFNQVQDKLRTTASSAQSAYSSAEAQYDRQISAYSKGFDESEYAKQITELQNASVKELEELEPLLQALQDQADIAFNETMLSLSKQLSDENAAQVLELQKQTALLGILPEKITETNAALKEQIDAAKALLEEARKQSENSHTHNADLVKQIETLNRRIDELTREKAIGANKP